MTPTSAGRLSASALATILLMFGMLWMSIMLMQDFDLEGRLKAVMLVGLAIATAALIWTVEANEAGRRVLRRYLTGVTAGLAAMLVVFAALTPSHLTSAEALAAAGLAATPLILRATGLRSQIALDRLPALLTILCIALALNRLRMAFGYLHAPDMEDIGKTTIAAVHTVFSGRNPYATPLDRHPEYPEFPGYKYLPMMIAVYAPLGSLFDQTGLRLTNLGLDLLMTVTILLSARRIGGRVAGLLAVSAYLMLPVLPRDIYKHGVTDLAPVLPLVVALSLSGTRLGRAGLLIGLSVAAKLFPGLLVALCCLRRPRLGYYLICGIVGILPAVAFYFWGPEDFTRNVFLFILSRPLDETSWMFGMAPLVPMVAKLVYFLFLLAVLIHLVTATPGMVRRCGLIVLCIVGALLTGPDAHNNYMIWWVPFFCILLGVQLSSIIQYPAGIHNGERA
jgi:hypothetical protein